MCYYTQQRSLHNEEATKRFNASVDSGWFF
jgi:hypothetical protein